MKTTAALVKFSIFAVVTVLLTGVLITTIANTDFTAKNDYSAVFSDVTGLIEGDDVRVAGVRIGKVEKIEIHDRNRAKVSFSVDTKRPLSTTTIAAVRYRNLIGTRYLGLFEGPGTGTELKPGATIPLERTQPPLDLTVVFNGFRPLFTGLNPEDVNKLSFEIIRTLQGEGDTFESLLGHTASLTSSLADRDETIGQLIDNMNVVLGTVNERDEKLSDLIVQLQRFLSGFAQDREAIGDALTNINGVAVATAELLTEVRQPLRENIREINDLSTLLNRNEKVTEEILRRLPGKLNRISRTATYGSWFNFYLCDFDGRIVLPSGQTYTPAFHNDVARCNP